MSQHKGISTRTNADNGFRVVELHYSSDPDKDEAWAALNRARYPPDKWDQEFELKRTATTLLVWPGFDPSIHVIDPADYEFHTHYRMVVGVDPGFDHPFASVLVAIDGDGRAVVVDEHCERAQLVSWHAGQLLSKLRNWYDLDPRMENGKVARHADWVIDPSQAQIIHELSLFGILAVRKRDSRIKINDVSAGINRVGEWLAPDENGVPRLRILSTCTQLISQIKSYQWARTTTGQPIKDKVRKVDDDLPDALRYAMMLRPRAALVPTDTPDPSTMSETMRRHLRRQRRLSRSGSSTRTSGMK